MKMNLTFKRLLTLVLAVMMMVTAMPVGLLAEAQEPGVNYDVNPIKGNEHINREKIEVKPAKPGEGETAEDLVNDPTLPEIYTLHTDYLTEKGEKYVISYQPYVASVGADATQEEKDKINKTIKLPNLAGYIKPQDSFTDSYGDIVLEAGKGKNNTKYREFKYDAENKTIKVKHLFQDLEDFAKYTNLDGSTDEANARYSIQSGNTGSTMQIKPLDEIDRKGFVPEAEYISMQVPEDTTDFIIEYRYNRAHYNVSYDTTGGTAIPNRSLYYEQEIPKLNDIDIPKKVGCEFLGWKPSVDLEGTFNGAKKTFKANEIIKDANGKAIKNLDAKLIMPAQDIKFKAEWKEKEKADYAVQFWVEKADHADGASLLDKYEYMGTRVYKDKDTGTRPDLDTEPVKGLKFPDLDQARLNKIWANARFNRSHDLYLNKFFVYNKDLTDKENKDPENSSLVKKVEATGKTVYNIYYDRQVYTLYFTKSNAQPEKNTIYPEIYGYDPKKKEAVMLGGPGNPYHYKARFNEMMYKWPNDAKQTKGFTPGYQSFGWGPNYDRPNWPKHLDTPPYRLNADEFLDMENYISWGGYIKHIDKGDGTTIDLDKLDFTTLSFGIKQDKPSIPHHMDFWMDGFKKNPNWDGQNPKEQYQKIIAYDLVRTKADTDSSTYGHRYPIVQGFTPYNYDPKDPQSGWPVIKEGQQENGRVNEDEINNLNDERDEISPNTSGKYYNNYGTKLPIGQLEFISAFFSDTDEFGDPLGGDDAAFKTNGYLRFFYKRNKYPLRFNYDPSKIKDDSEFNNTNQLDTYYQFPLKALSPTVDENDEYKKVGTKEGVKNLLDNPENLKALGLTDLIFTDKDGKLKVKRPENLSDQMVFKGWALDPAGTKLIWENENEIMPTHPVNLFAKWGEPDYKWKITFDPDGGKLKPINEESITTKRKTIQEGDIGQEEKNTYAKKEDNEGNKQIFTVIQRQKLVEPAAPTRKGYDFMGWELIRYKKDAKGDFTDEQDLSYREKYKVPELYTFGNDVVSPLYLKAIWVPNQKVDVDVEHYFLDEDFKLDNSKRENPIKEVLRDKRLNYYVATTADKQDKDWLIAPHEELEAKLKDYTDAAGVKHELRTIYDEYNNNHGLKNSYFQTFRLEPKEIVDTVKTAEQGKTVYMPNPKYKEYVFKFFYRPFRKRVYKVNYVDERAKKELEKATTGTDKEAIIEKYSIIPQETVKNGNRYYDARNYRHISGWTLADKPQQQLFFDVNEDTNALLGINGTGSDEITFYYKDVRVIETKKDDPIPKGYVRVTFKASDGGSFGKDKDGKDIKELYYDVIKGLYSDYLPVPQEWVGGEDSEGKPKEKDKDKYYITPDDGRSFIKWDKKPLLNKKTVLDNKTEDFYVFTAYFDWSGLSAKGLVRTEAFKDPNGTWTNDFAPTIKQLKAQLVWKEKDKVKDLPEGTEIKFFDEAGKELKTDEDVFKLVDEINKADKDELVRTVNIKVTAKFKDEKDTQELNIPIIVYKNVYEALNKDGDKPLFLSEAEKKDAKDGGLKDVTGNYIKVTVAPTGDMNAKDNKVYYVNPKAWVEIPEVKPDGSSTFINWTADIAKQNDDGKANGNFDFAKRHMFTEETVIKPVGANDVVEQEKGKDKPDVPKTYVKVIVKTTDKATDETAFEKTFWVNPSKEVTINVTKPSGKKVNVDSTNPKEFTWKFTKWTSNEVPARSWGENIDSGIRAQFTKETTIIAKYEKDVLEQGTVLAKEITVHESYKDGTTWINNFIEKEATEDILKKAIKIRGANGADLELPADAKIEFLDQNGTVKAYADLADELYEKLQEKDDKANPSRLEYVKAKVTFKNKEVQKVDIPVKVIKNIYEAKTLTEKPYYVPDTYKKVTLDPTTTAEDPQKTYYYVNPEAKVVIPGKDPVGKGLNTFTKWTLGEDEYKLSERHQFADDATIKANYSKDVVPAKTDGSKPEGTPQNFVKVTFVPTDKATDKAEIIFYVNPDKELTLPVNDPVAIAGHTFNEWKMGANADGNKYDPSTAQKFEQDTIITATYSEDLIEQKGTQKPNDVPTTHVEVIVKYTNKAEFKDTSNNPLTGADYDAAITRIFWVNPNKEVTLPVVKPVGKAVPANGSDKAYMYQFTKWTSNEKPSRTWSEGIDTGITTSFAKNTVITANYDKVVTDHGKVEANEITVHESYKDGDKWINNFIDKEATREKLLAALNINGAALSNNAKVELLDDSEKAFANDEALKNDLYDKLKEKDDDKPSRTETIKAKVTFDNGEIQIVDIPIKVIKNIYEAKTLAKKPIYVPDDYVKVTLDPTTKATNPQRTYFYVNPKAQVVIPGTDPTGTGDNKFIKWTMKADDESGKGADYNLSDRHKFEKASTITAIYSADVIPQEGTEKPDGVPENFVEVIFDPTNNGTLDGAKTFWVKPDTDVTIPVKDPVGKQYFTFKKWKIGADPYDPTSPKKFTKKQTDVVAVYEEAKNIIPYDPSVSDQMQRPEGYARVTFAADTGLKLTEQKAYYVKKNAGIKLGNADLVKPGYNEEIGYKFDKWDQENNTTIIEDDVVVTAKATIIPDFVEKTSTNPDKPDDRYVTVTFKAGEHGTVTEKTYFVNPTKYVHLTPPSDAKGKTGYEFATWTSEDADFNTANFRVYTKDTIILAKFNQKDSVVPVKDNQTKKPDGYVEVIFDVDAASINYGKLEGITKYYVDPSREVTIPAPNAAAGVGYIFDKWTLTAGSNTIDNFNPQNEHKYTEKTTRISASFKKLADIVPMLKAGQTKPNIKPHGYVTVRFMEGAHAEKLEGNGVYYVNPNANPAKTLGDPEIVKPTITPDIGWEQKTGDEAWKILDKTAAKDDIEIKEDLYIIAQYQAIADFIEKTNPSQVPPRGYVTVTFKAGAHGKIKDGANVITQKVYFVNPNKYVLLKAPDTEADTNYAFASWTQDIGSYTNDYTKYEQDTIITANFNPKEKVIPVKSGTSKPNNYVTVTFVIEDTKAGSIKAREITSYYVAKNEDVKLNPPALTINTGYKFEKWVIKPNGAEEEIVPQNDNQYTEDTTTIYAKTKTFPSVISAKEPNGTVNPQPKGYVTVTFEKGDHGVLDGQAVFYVNPEAGVKLGDNSIVKPDVIPANTYTHSGWDIDEDGKADDNAVIEATEIKKDITVKAIYTSLPPIIKAGPTQTAPSGYVVIIFKTDGKGTLLDNAIKDPKPADRDKEREIVYFVNPNRNLAPQYDVKLVDENTAVSDTKLPIPSPVPNNTVKTKFDKWIEEIDYTSPIKRGRVYVATFKPIEVKLTYYANGATGDVPAVVTVDYGTSVRLANQGKLTKKDAKFIGWEIDGHTYAVGEEITLIEDTTAVAKWEDDKNIIKYDPEEPTARPDGYVRVTFAADNGLKLTEQKAYYVKKDKNLTLATIKGDTTNYGYPDVIASTGYEFDGWDKDDSIVIGDTDVVVKAKAKSLPDFVEKTDEHPNKPDTNYRTVIFKADNSGNGTVTEKTYFVNPNKYVKLTPPSGDDVKAKTGYEFASWSQDARVPTQYTDEITTITARFNQLGAVSKEQKTNYVKVEFKIEGDGGSIVDGQTTTYYVDPNRAVTLNAPKVKAETGYEFDKWDQDPSTSRKYVNNTTIKGTFKKIDDIIPATNDEGKPNAKPEGYVKVVFVSSKDGKLLDGENNQINEKVYYVNPKTGQVIRSLGKPKADPNVGFEKAPLLWHILGAVNDKPTFNLDSLEIKGDMTLIAEYKPLPDVVEKKTEGGKDNKPKGYITVKFSTEAYGKISDTNNTEKEVYINPNKQPIVLRGQEPDVTANTGYLFSKWSVDINSAQNYTDNQVIRAVYTERENIFTAEKPGYVKVVFKTDANGSLDGLTELWVKPGVKVNIPQPKVNPNTGYNFEKWNRDTTVTLQASNKPYEITAEYKTISDVVAGSDAQPSGYVKVEFKADKNGTLSGTTIYYVNPNKQVDLTEKANAINKNPNTGFTAEGGTWSPEITKQEYKVNAEYEFTFKTLPDIIEETAGQTKPDGYVKVEFIAGENGSLNGGNKTYYVNPLKDIKLGTGITVPTPNGKENYVFDSWYEAIDKTEEIKNDKKFVARFKLGKVTMTYKADDKTSGDVPAALSYDIGTEITLAGANDLKKDNYVLTGWNIDGTTYMPGAKYKIEKDATATAVWEEGLHTVEFDTDGGSYIATQKVKHEGLIAQVNAPTKDGFTFIGWKLDDNKFDTTRDKVTKDITLVAQYVPNVIEQTGGNKPADTPDDFVKVIVKTTEENIEKATEATKFEKTFWVKKDTQVTINVTNPTGDTVKDASNNVVTDVNGKPLVWKFKKWSMPLTNAFSVETTITAEYEKTVPKPTITADTVVTGVKDQPTIDMYKKALTAKLGEEGIDFETKVQNLEVITKPNVDKAGNTSANVKITFTNGESKEVEVPVLVVDEVVEQIGKDKPSVPDTYVKVTVDTTVKATDNTYFVKTFWVKPGVEVWVPVNNPTGKVEAVNGVRKLNKFINWKVKDGDKVYESIIKDIFSEETIIEAVYEQDKDVEPNKIDGKWLPLNSEPSPRDFISNTYDDNDPNNVNNLPPGTRYEFKDGTKPNTNSPVPGSTTIVITYPNGKVEEKEVNYNVSKDVIYWPDGEDAPARPENYVCVRVTTKVEVSNLEEERAQNAIDKRYWVNPTKEITIPEDGTKIVGLSNPSDGRQWVFDHWQRRDNSVNYGHKEVTGIFLEKEPGSIIVIEAFYKKAEEPKVEPQPQYPEVIYRDRIVEKEKIVEKIVKIKDDERLKEIRYMQGFNGKFRPNDGLRRAEAAQILANALKADGYSYDPYYAIGYSDVGNTWYTEAVRIVSQAGVFQGYSDGTFKPEGKITRAEWIATLRRFQNLRKANGNDMGLSMGHWATEEVEAAYQAGWLDVYTSGIASFDYNKPITRQEVAAISNKAFERVLDKVYLKRNVKNMINYTDINPSMPLFEDILCASNTLLTDGRYYKANTIVMDNVTFNIVTDEYKIYQKRFQFDISK